MLKLHHQYTTVKWHFSKMWSHYERIQIWPSFITCILYDLLKGLNNKLPTYSFPTPGHSSLLCGKNCLFRLIQCTRHLSEKALAPHSSTPAWKILGMEEPGRLQSVGSLIVGHDWVTSLSRLGGGNGNPLQCSCLENPRDGGAWWAAVYGVAQSRTQLKWLSSSSSSSMVYKTLH